MKSGLLSIIIISVFFLSACETMEGLGRDIQKAGGALEGSAKDSK